MLLYGDESEALTHPYLARAWVQRGADLRVPAPGQAKTIAMMGALDWTTRQLIVTTSRTKKSTDFITLLQTLNDLYGPRPGLTMKPVVIVLNNGPIHTSKATTAAIASLAHWLTVEWLPKYTPELNDFEVVCGDLEARHLAHQAFTGVEALDAAVTDAVKALNKGRKYNPLGSQRISAESLLDDLKGVPMAGLISPGAALRSSNGPLLPIDLSTVGSEPGHPGA